MSRVPRAFSFAGLAVPRQRGGGTPPLVTGTLDADTPPPPAAGKGLWVPGHTRWRLSTVQVTNSGDPGRLCLEQPRTAGLHCTRVARVCATVGAMHGTQAGLKGTVFACSCKGRLLGDLGRVSRQARRRRLDGDRLQPGPPLTLGPAL